MALEGSSGVQPVEEGSGFQPVEEGWGFQPMALKAKGRATRASEAK